MTHNKVSLLLAFLIAFIGGCASDGFRPTGPGLPPPAPSQCALTQSLDVTVMPDPADASKGQITLSRRAPCVKAAGGRVEWRFLGAPNVEFKGDCFMVKSIVNGSAGIPTGTGAACGVNLTTLSSGQPAQWDYGLVFYTTGSASTRVWTCDPTIVNHDAGGPITIPAPPIPTPCSVK